MYKMFQISSKNECFGRTGWHGLLQVQRREEGYCHPRKFFQITSCASLISQSIHYLDPELLIHEA